MNKQKGIFPLIPLAVAHIIENNLKLFLTFTYIYTSTGPSLLIVAQFSSWKSSESTAKPIVIANQASVGISPFPLHPAFLQQADVRNNIRVDALASNPSRKKISYVIFILSLHETRSWVFACFVGIVHYRKFSMASLCQGVPLAVKCNTLLCSTPAEKSFSVVNDSREQQKKLYKWLLSLLTTTKILCGYIVPTAVPYQKSFFNNRKGEQIHYAKLARQITL